MQEKSIEKQIERTKKEFNNNSEWIATYYKQLLKTLLDNMNVIEQFRKVSKEYESSLQFYLVEIKPNETDLFYISAKYMGQDVATIRITKDRTTVTTEQYNESNKKDFNCEITLKDENWNTTNSRQFLEYFRNKPTRKTKLTKVKNIEHMLLSEFSKTSSYDKLLVGIQPIKYGNLYLRIPITINQKHTEYINILARTRVKKLSIIELINENENWEEALNTATTKAVYLTNMLHSEYGANLYKLFGFSREGSNTINYKNLFNNG